MLRALTALCIAFCGLVFTTQAEALTYEDYPVVRLRSLDKITARTMTFEAKVGTTVRFGDIYIKVQSCRKPPPVEKPESSAFLQIWEVDDQNEKSRWIYSGWMFASSPALSAMDHPIYDVWVLDCLGRDPEPIPVEETATPAPATDGEVPDAQPPVQSPEEQTPIQHGPEDTTEDTTEGTTETVPATNIPGDAATANETPTESEVPAEDNALDSILNSVTGDGNAPAQEQQPDPNAPYVPRALQEGQPDETPSSDQPVQDGNQNYQGIY